MRLHSLPEPVYLKRVTPQDGRDRFGIPENCLNCPHRRGAMCAIYYKQRVNCLTRRLEQSRAFSDSPQEVSQ